MQFQEENNENDINVEELDYMGPAAINEVEEGYLGFEPVKTREAFGLCSSY